MRTKYSERTDPADNEAPRHGAAQRNLMIDLIHGFIEDKEIVEINLRVEKEAGGPEKRILTVEFY